MRYGFTTAALHTKDAESRELQKKLAGLSPWLGKQEPETLEAEAVMAALDRGAGCAAFSSAWGAWSRLLRTLCTPGMDALVSRRLCASVHGIVKAVLTDMGVGIKYIDSGHPCQTQKTMDENSCIVIAPSLSAPETCVAALESIGRIAARWGVPFIADNSLATPALCTPAERGADIVVTSSGGFLAQSGESDVCFVTDAGSFDWKKNAGKYPGICAPDAGFGGVVFMEAFPEAPLAAKLRMLSMRGAESGVSACEAEELLQSAVTLRLRMERQGASALAAAKLLEASPAVKAVSYPSLESHSQNDMAAVYLKDGCGAVVSFELNGGEDAFKRFAGALGFIKPAANAGGPKTALFRAVFAGKETLCLSVGLEDFGDIKTELEDALAAAGE